MGRTVSPPTRAGTWFNPDLRKKDYDRSGDAYEDAKYIELEKKWSVDSGKNTYLTLVKQASKTKWIHLRLLADFMQIGRIPRDWDNIRLDDREATWGRANIRVLDYSRQDPGQAPQVRSIITPKGGKGLSTVDIKRELDVGAISSNLSFRLYVVEDLSRNVIEALGTAFGIDPDFFRAHITDYAWANVRDRWREPQPLEVVRNQRNWFQIRYVTTRYFATRERQADATAGGCFEEALEEAKDFNILRRPDDDKSRGWWDSKNAVVALTRSRATFWHRPKDSQHETAIGVLLLDPVVSQGLPLWRGHRNFHPAPATFEELQRDKTKWETPSYDNKQSFLQDFTYWAANPHVFSSFSSSSSSSSSPQPDAAPDAAPAATTASPQEHLPVQTLLHLIAAEWLTMCDYIKTRLNQIELETTDPLHFAEEQRVDIALGKLHMWRRFVPLYREMVSETLQHVFCFPCHHYHPGLVGPSGLGLGLSCTGAEGGVVGTPGRTPGMSYPVQTIDPSNNTASHDGPSPRTSMMMTMMMNGHGTTSPTSRMDGGAGQCSCSSSSSSSSSIKAYGEDFRLVLKYMEEYQTRIDRLTSVVTAVMAVDDTRRAISDARNIGRLTWLATFFIPFSVVSGIFSMQNLSDISRDTLRVYFATTLPVAVVTVAFAWALHSPVVLGWLHRLTSLLARDY